MAVITISRGSYSKGKEIAERVAARLGYECVSREILLEASEHFNIPEVKLVRALHDAPSVLDRFARGRERFEAYIQQAFLEHVQKDNVVYHGLAGHFFLQQVAHSLKVRVIADLEERVRLEARREGISEAKAREILQKDDAERRAWSMHLHGIDTADPRLYDLVLHIHKLEVDDAVEIICHTVGLPRFATTAQSQQALDSLLLCAKVRTAVAERWAGADVRVKNGEVFVKVEAPLDREAQVQTELQDLARRVDGVDRVRVLVMPLDSGD
jgi:cytidylate kinase